MLSQDTQVVLQRKPATPTRLSREGGDEVPEVRSAGSDGKKRPDVESELAEATFRRETGRPTHAWERGWSKPRHGASNFEKRIVSCIHRSESTGIDASPRPRGGNSRQSG